MLTLTRSAALRQFYAISFSLLTTILAVRVYEYISVASKFFINNAWQYEVTGLLYDAWLWLIYCFVFFLPFLLLRRVNKKLATIIFHFVNTLFIIIYLGLIVVFSERNTPFDHEFFTRSIHESILTSKQMLTSSYAIYIPFVVYIATYFLLYLFLFRKLSFTNSVLIVAAGCSLAAVCFIKFANPSPDNFSKDGAYYLTSNKLTFWIADSYDYFKTKDKYNSGKLNNAQLEKEIDFYQKNQPFQFTSKEYPLMHVNNTPDVLGGYFNLRPSPPNIVILVVEGLSRDFSGDNAYAGSFTPFLDSLSKKSLVWDNFLSTAPGTFAAHPAISGSLPYGKRGFSIMNIMPDHLSLIKILKANGYYTTFMIGFNPDFDNMGGYIRLQGTDFILSHYGPQYKEMGVGKEGWSMGYPDDALFPRSLQALDSINKNPYLTIYHTATTHMPYLFEQKPAYEKLFDKKLQTMNVSASIKKTLKATKDVLVTFMFSDDCIKKFFADFAKRPEYNNTIFFITGDHHIGSFPSTGEIDDYHVPFIVYSPMLKAPAKFLSVNSHNDIAPTISALILNNYKMPFQPKEVHWLGSGIDTCKMFRNIHSMPFMSWSREINDYIYKDYFLSGNQLYKLSPNLLEEECTNESLKKYIKSLRENFKIINDYVCQNNKIYKADKELLPGNKVLLLHFQRLADTIISTNLSNGELMKNFRIPEGFKYLYAEVSANVLLPSNLPDEPTLRLALVDTKNNGMQFLYWSKREISTLSKGGFTVGKWNAISTNDMFTLDDYKKVKNLYFELAVFSTAPSVSVKFKNLDVKIYGIKNDR